MKQAFVIFLLLVAFRGHSQKKTKTENVILVTLDGMRWQEIFSGAEKRLITSEFVKDSAGVMNEFWAQTPEQRREKMMPFLWKVMAPKGQIYGNRQYGNLMNVTNKQWFSYPGYNELLSGFADDERIQSNDKFYNPNKTVLEFINNQPGFKGKVMVYGSWDVFSFIVNTERSGIKVNAGLVEAKPANERDQLLNTLMKDVPNPLGDVRLDAFTFQYGLEEFKRSSPRLFYLAFDETDDFAHNGNYEQYLKSARATDGMIQTLWEYCQSNPRYKNKTTLLITCDHGRGTVNKDDWRHHGIKVPNADQIWLAAIGPDTPAIGELKSTGQIYQSQVAKTIAALLGLEYVGDRPVGEPIEAIFHK